MYNTTFDFYGASLFGEEGHPIIEGRDVHYSDNGIELYRGINNAFLAMALFIEVVARHAWN